MKNINLVVLTLFVGLFLFTGCAKQAHFTGANSPKTAPVTMGIDRQDFEKAAADMVDSLLVSGALVKNQNNPRERYVVMISDVVNDTTQRLDTRMLTKKIRIAMLRSGKAVVTSAVGTERDDTTINASRQTRNNKEFNQKTSIKEGQLINAELGLQGRIMQRVAKTNDGDQLVEYYFQMTLTNAVNGLAYWEDEVIIGKLGSNDTVTW